MMASPYLKALEMLVDLGGSVVMAGMFLYFGLKAMKQLGRPFIETQQQMAAAMQGIQQNVQELVCRDNNEHREILLGLQVMGQEFKELNETLSNRREDNASQS